MNPRAARSASGTNNQVAGVDEADIVKTDGRYVYLALNGALRIVEALEAARRLGDQAPRQRARALRRGRSRRRLHGERRRRQALHLRVRLRVRRRRHVDAHPRVRHRQSRGAQGRPADRSLRLAHGGAPHRERRCTPSSPTATRRHAVYATWPADLETCGTKERVVRAKFAKLKLDERAQDPARALGFRRSAKTASKSRSAAGSCAPRSATGRPSRRSSRSTSRRQDARGHRRRSRAARARSSRPTTALYLSVVHQKADADGRWYSFYPVGRRGQRNPQVQVSARTPARRATWGAASSPATCSTSSRWTSGTATCASRRRAGASRSRAWRARCRSSPRARAATWSASARSRRSRPARTFARCASTAIAATW